MTEQKPTKPPSEDDVLRRMLNTPPKQHDKPASKKPAKKQPAK